MCRDPDGADEDDVLRAGEKLKREEHLELAPVELDRAGPVEGLQGRPLLEASQIEAPLERLLVTALDLVGQQQGQIYLHRHVSSYLHTSRSPIRYVNC